MGDKMNRPLFDQIERLRESIPKDEQEEMVTDIIEILKKHQLTYTQAYSMLGLTRDTLAAISVSLIL